MVASFKRKVVLVTGGGSGIGQASAVAFARKGATAESTEENWERVVAGNLKSVWLCMKYEIPQMLRQGGGLSLLRRPCPV